MFAHRRAARATSLQLRCDFDVQLRSWRDEARASPGQPLPLRDPAMPQHWEMICRVWPAYAEPLHVAVDLRISPSGVSTHLSFPNPKAKVRSLDEYTFSCISLFLDKFDINAGEEIKLFVPKLAAQHTFSKCSTKSADGKHLWRASWEDSFEEPLEQAFLCSELFNDIFEGEESLWCVEDASDHVALLRASEYLALPQPRPEASTISMLNGESVAVESEMGESEMGESEAGEREAGEREAGESEAGESEAGESEASESEDDESNFNFPVDAVTVELRKGRGAKLEGTFIGRAGDKLGVWDSYLRFDAVESCSEGVQFLWRGDCVKTPAASDGSAVLVRILGARKPGGHRSSSSTGACYICLIFCPKTQVWVYATMPNVTPCGQQADATLMASIEDALASFKPVGVSAAISQASRAVTGKTGKRTRDD